MNVNQIKEITQDLLSNPAAGWEKHKNDFSSENQILSEFAAPLIVAGAAATLIKMTLFGGRLTGGLLLAVLEVIVGLVALYIVSYVTKFVAEKFDGHPTNLDAFRFIALGSSAGWIGKILTVIPYLGALISLVLSLYGIYIMYKGITPCIGVPESKRTIFFIVSGIVVTVITMIFASLISGVVIATVGFGAIAG